MYIFSGISEHCLQCIMYLTTAAVPVFNNTQIL